METTVIMWEAETLPCNRAPLSELGSRAGWDGIWVNAIRMDGLIHVSSRGARQISSACPTGISGVGHDQLPSALIISTGTPGDGSIPSMGGHFHRVMDTLPARPARGLPALWGM